MDTEWRSSSGSVCSRDNANDRSDLVSVIGCFLSRLVRQCCDLPVKLNPMARSFGRDREPALYLKWLGEVGFKPKAMSFEISSVGNGREQMDGDIVGPVTGDRKIVRLR
jgi:hypothetical protein